MSLDILIPFLILLFLVIYLIYTRNKFEKNIIELYEKKFEHWKDNSTHNEKNDKNYKQLVGLVFKEEYNITVEILEDKQSVKNSLQRGKFDIKDK
ncbi:MAG: hypothetical protein ACNI25_13525 [Halarcobacter sp.]